MSTSIDIQEKQNSDADFVNTIGANGVWSSARASSYNQTLWSEGPTYGRAIGQYYSGSYYVDRGHISFDTSALPDNAIILSALLRLKVKDLTWCLDAATYDFGLIIKAVTTGAKTREQVFDEAISASSLGYLCSSWKGITHSVGSWLESEVNLKNSINLTGDTDFSVISTRDVDGTLPPATSGNNSKLDPAFYAGNNADRAVLRVVYVINPEAPSSFVATANGTSQIDLSWVDNGGATSGFVINQSTDGMNYGFDDYVIAAGETTKSITGLSVGVPYWFRIQAVNPNGRSAEVQATPTPAYTQYAAETSTVEIITGGV